jgi:transposase-like protein
MTHNRNIGGYDKLEENKKENKEGIFKRILRKYRGRRKDSFSWARKKIFQMVADTVGIQEQGLTVPFC